MSGELPSVNGQNEIIQTVTSVGNSWVICRSKSHSGRIYYFNTLTGEAAWNLSDSEVEKAQKRTKILESQSGTDLNSCPEPKEPPMDSADPAQNTHHNTPVCVPSRVYNKQIINNKFPKQAYTLPFISTKCNDCQSVDSPIGINVPSAAFNPNIWAIPPNHHIVIAPTVPPIVNQSHTPGNLAYNNLDTVSVENTSLPLSKRFNLIRGSNFQRQKPRFSREGNKFNPRIYNSKFGQRKGNTPSYRNFNRQLNTTRNRNDLRQVISARRNCAWNNTYKRNCHDEASFQYLEKSPDKKIEIIKPSTDELYPSDEDDVWLKKHASVQGSQLKLNISPLKNMVTTDNNSNCWFLVADVNVLLNHFNFINIVVNSDEKCQLMVPGDTMAELQACRTSDDVVVISRAHLVLRLLSQQFDLGRAVMGKDPSKCHNILEFTLKLSGQNYDVVLVSNNKILRKYNNQIPIFTIQDIKDILGNKEESEPIFQTPHSLAECSINITIPNHVDLEEFQNSIQLRKMSKELSDDTKVTELTDDIPNNNKRIDIQTDTFVASRLTTDAGVQTDFISSKKVDVATNIDGTNQDQDNSNTIITEQKKNCDEIVNTIQNNRNLDEVPKKRSIRLKRNISQQSNPGAESNIEKKQFKWRRKKRNISPIRVPGSEPPKSNNSFSTVTKDVDQSISNFWNHVEDTTINTEKDFTDHQYEEKSDDNKSYDDNMNSSEASSCCYIQQKIDEKIIIEETSTSGIISNSTSYVDSISASSLQPIAQTKNDDKNSIKCVIFEVESPTMEECLRTKSEEWVSRFVQIMEEVLSQTLQQDPPFFNVILRPPWTLHEAAECIKKKFKNDSDVIDASTKLTNILYRISDDRGKISNEMKPTEFMEMYSYGVYLVDALQSILNNSEDLQAAADSLANLLIDIQDTNMDVVHNDSFIDTIEDPSANVTRSSSSFSTNREENVGSIINMSREVLSPVIEQTVSDEDSNQRKYNLRSNQKRKATDARDSEKVGNVQFIRTIDIESTFFSTLHLKRKDNENDGGSKNIDSYDLVDTANKNPDLNMSKEPMQEESNELEKNTVVDKQVTSEPKIIRNFSKCLEFEKRLLNKQRELFELENEDYPEDQEEGEYYDEEFNYDYDYYPDEETEGVDKLNNYDIANIDHEIELPKNNTVDQNGNYTFDWIAGRIMKEVRQTFEQVHNFCDKTRGELEVSKKMSSQRKEQILEEAGTVRIHMDKLCQSLKSVLSREDKGGVRSFQTILQEAGIHLDVDKSMEYRNIISKCSDQAHILLESVDILIEAVK